MIGVKRGKLPLEGGDWTALLEPVLGGNTSYKKKKSVVKGQREKNEKSL